MSSSDTAPDRMANPRMLLSVSSPRTRTPSAREKAFATLSQEVLGHQIERLREAAGVPITGEDGHLPRIREVLGLTVQEADAVWEEFLSEGDLNAYGLGNAITKVSQGVEGFERATELEGIGWKATGMPWGRILW